MLNAGMLMACVLSVCVAGIAQGPPVPFNDGAAMAAQDVLARSVFPVGIYMDGRVEGINCFPGYVNVPHDVKKARAYYEKIFSDIKEHNIDYVIIPNTPPDYREILLDAADRAGVKIMLEVAELASAEVGQDLCVRSADMVSDEAVLQERLATVVEPLRTHPSLFAYQIIDEPPAAYAENIDRTCRVLRRIDPKHPPFGALCSLAELPRTTHMGYSMVTYDSYQIGEASTPGQYDFYNFVKLCDIIRDHADTNGLPYWMVIQTFGKGGSLRMPTIAEIRATAYCSISENAKGILFFLYNSWSQEEKLEGVVDRDLEPRPVWDEIGTLAAELQQLGPVFTTLRPVPTYVGASGGNVLVRCFEGPRQSRYVLLTNLDVLNPVDFTGTIGNPVAMSVQEVHDVLTDAAVPVEPVPAEGVARFTLHIAPGDGRLLHLGR
jgi:hypothetical protein